MAFRVLTKASVALALAVTPMASSAGNDLVGGLIGGMIGAAIVNGAQPKRKVYRSTGVSSAVREERRTIQTSLNHFGFPAGTPDGVLGRRSRTAITNYQIFMRFGATGTLTDYEKNILISAYHRSIAGGADVQRLVARSRDGIKAVLLDQRDGMQGGGARVRSAGYPGLPLEVSIAVDEISDSSDPSPEQLLQSSGFIQMSDLNRDGKNDYILDTSYSGSEYWCNAQRCRTLVFVSTAQGYTRNDLLQHNPTPAHFLCQGPSCEVKEQVQTAVAPVQVPQPGQGNNLSTFVVDKPRVQLAPLPIIQTAPEQQALSSHCSKVTLLTGSNGGFVTLANMTDPTFALNEQFCLARTYSIAEGEELIKRVQGVSLAQVEQQCDAFGAAVKQHISNLSLQPATNVIQAVNSFILNSGMQPTQLGGTAKICLATGYRKDNLDTAIGAALILTGIGQHPYAELMGHHLSQGFGVSKRADLAKEWYNISLSSLDGGAAPVFAPTQSGRVEILRAAASGAVSGGQAGAGNSVLPVFSVSE